MSIFSSKGGATAQDKKYSLNQDMTGKHFKIDGALHYVVKSTRGGSEVKKRWLHTYIKATGDPKPQQDRDSQELFHEGAVFERKEHKHGCSCPKRADRTLVNS